MLMFAFVFKKGRSLIIIARLATAAADDDDDDDLPTELFQRIYSKEF